MTNAQAQSYAIIALKNILKYKGWHLKDIKDYCKDIDREMYDLMDIMDEVTAESTASKILQGQ